MQTENADARSKFIASVFTILTKYEFDGVDLAWQFPATVVKTSGNTFSKAFVGLKRTFGAGKFTDKYQYEHRTGFANLVYELKKELNSINKDLTLTVLPHVNYEGKELYSHMQYLNGHYGSVIYFFSKPLLVPPRDSLLLVCTFNHIIII